MRTGIAHGILLSAAFGLAACTSKETVLVKPVEVAQQPAADVLKHQPPAADVQKHQQPAADVTMHNPPPAVVQKHQPQVSPLHKKVDSLLEKKNYRQAIELMKGRNHEGLEKEYILAVNRLLEAGDDELSRGNYVAAARSFKTVLDAYPSDPFPRERLSHDPKQIRSSLETCANRLMEQGIEEYRHGRLDSAIRKWKSVLMIIPGHQQAKKSLDTATIQLQELKNLKSR
jgi:tetratricopeptide (TPR) repeat protein